MRAFIAVISDLCTDMRVQKHAMLLYEMGFDVTLAGRLTGAFHEPVLHGIRTIRLRIPFTKGPMMYFFFNAALMMKLLFHRKADLYLANDLDTLMPCFLAARLFRRPLVYDAHEYFTGQYSLTGRKFRHSLWKKTERLLMPGIRHMMTVSDSIAELYRKEYGVAPLVIRNVALSADHIVAHQRSDLVTGADDLLLVYQDGAGDNPGRGAAELLEALTLVDKVRLIIIGSGKRIDEARKLVRTERLENKVIFLSRMYWHEMMRYLKCCDAAFSIDKDTCINQRLSLPNRLFDAIAAGVPVIVSPLPEVSALVRHYGCGIILDKMSPGAIQEAIVLLRDDRQYLKELKAKAAEAARDLNWDREKVKEQDFFKSVIEKKSK